MINSILACRRRRSRAPADHDRLVHLISCPVHFHGVTPKPFFFLSLSLSSSLEWMEIKKNVPGQTALLRPNAMETEIERERRRKQGSAMYGSDAGGPGPFSV